jgi:hypothetical protein
MMVVTFALMWQRHIRHGRVLRRITRHLHWDIGTSLVSKISMFNSISSLVASAFTTDLNKRVIWVDGFPVYTIPYYKGERLLSEFQENFELARPYASLAAEMSDFRFYYEELSTKDLQLLQSKWINTRKGSDWLYVFDKQH